MIDSLTDWVGRVFGEEHDSVATPPDQYCAESSFKLCHQHKTGSYSIYFGYIFVQWRGVVHLYNYSGVFLKIHSAYLVSWVCWQPHAGWKRPTGPERSPRRAGGHVPLRSPRGAPLRWAADWSWTRLQSKAWGSPGAPPNTLYDPREHQGLLASPRHVD